MAYELFKNKDLRPKQNKDNRGKPTWTLEEKNEGDKVVPTTVTIRSYLPNIHWRPSENYQ